MPNVPAWIRSWPRARHPRPHPGRGTHPLCADATSRNQPTCSRNGFPASCAPAAQDRLARSVKPVRASVTSDACHRVRAPRSRHGHVNEAGRKRSTPTFLPRARTGRPSLTKPPPVEWAVSHKHLSGSRKMPPDSAGASHTKPAGAPGQYRPAGHDERKRSFSLRTHRASSGHVLGYEPSESRETPGSVARNCASSAQGEPRFCSGGIRKNLRSPPAFPRGTALVAVTKACGRRSQKLLIDGADPVRGPHCPIVGKDVGSVCAGRSSLCPT